jgi:hypothetical protein
MYNGINVNVASGYAAQGAQPKKEEAQEQQSAPQVNITHSTADAMLNAMNVHSLYNQSQLSMSWVDQVVEKYNTPEQQARIADSMTEFEKQVDAEGLENVASALA